MRLRTETEAPGIRVARTELREHPPPTPHPSIIGLGKITHHSPKLNATSAQNSQSW